jgi:hypothetical protein
MMLCVPARQPLANQRPTPPAPFHCNHHGAATGADGAARRSCEWTFCAEEEDAIRQLAPAGWLTGSWRVSKTFPNVPCNGLVAIRALPVIRERGDLGARAVTPALSTSLPSIPIPASTAKNLPSPQPKQSVSVAFSGTRIDQTAAKRAQSSNGSNIRFTRKQVIALACRG